MKSLSRLVVLTLAILGIGAGPDHFDREVVGLWKRSNDWHHVVFLRRADGSYREKGLMSSDPWKSPVYYESTGSWRLRKGRYSETIRSWTEPTFRGSIGKTYAHEVLQVSRERFRYVSTDGFDEEELRIGDAADSDFEHAKVEPFPPYGGLKPEIIRRVKKATPVTP